MPIAEHDDYPAGHFKHVYEDIIKPACNESGYNPVRADDVLETNFIHLDILKKLIDSPMAICDLSTRNPNVLFELGLRQAFDKPVVLIQELGTPKIFDIAPLRYTEYRKQRVYHEVLEDQKKIKESIEATKKATDNKDGVNSIIQLLSLTSASLREVSPEDNNPMLQIVRAEMNELKNEFRRAIHQSKRQSDDSLDTANGLIGHSSHIINRAEELIAEDGSYESALEARQMLRQAIELTENAIETAPRNSKTFIRAKELRMKVMSLMEHVEVGMKRRKLSENEESTTRRVR